ncbi:hypothetical protein CUMW_276070 [Citrus unshiu]|uniref:Uncharacterized protein n=1 Tax=Citrus unshiu TaxID=55188 RepID=A0A2H5N0K9_CITUN|nr:hypothetical protein CUMW_276070 [Citrus unshiu]
MVRCMTQCSECIPRMVAWRNLNPPLYKYVNRTVSASGNGGLSILMIPYAHANTDSTFQSTNGRN